MKNLSIALTTFMLINIVGCSKYEDGPEISFISKKERVANTWEIDEAQENGEDVTDQYDEYTLQLLYDGDASLAALYTLGDLSVEYETNGTWEFEDSKEKLSLDLKMMMPIELT